MSATGAQKRYKDTQELQAEGLLVVVDYEDRKLQCVVSVGRGGGRGAGSGSGQGSGRGKVTGGGYGCRLPACLWRSLVSLSRHGCTLARGGGRGRGWGGRGDADAAARACVCVQNVHLEDVILPVECGEGRQKLKWLATVSCTRYGLLQSESRTQRLPPLRARTSHHPRP